MRTLGETLRQARLDKGLSLKDAAEATRVRRAYLEALEAGDSTHLPPPVYTRGFVRTYASYLGLNPDAMADMYEPHREALTPTLRHALPHVHVPREIPLRLVLTLAGILVAAVLVVSLWGFYQTLREAAQTDVGGVSRQRTPTVPALQPTLAPNLIASPSPSVISAPSPGATVIPSPTPAPTGILVQFRTTGRVYVEAAVDGQRVLAELLASGTARTLPQGNDGVVLRVSNPALVQITVNGTPLDPASGTAPVEYTWQR